MFFGHQKHNGINLTQVVPRHSHSQVISKEWLAERLQCFIKGSSQEDSDAVQNTNHWKEILQKAIPLTTPAKADSCPHQL